MIAFLLLLALLGVTYAGFAALALSQRPNWDILMLRRRFPAHLVRTLRACGFALLVSALSIALVRDGPSFGAILWTIMLAIGAALVAATLTFRRKTTRPR